MKRSGTWLSVTLVFFLLSPLRLVGAGPAIEPALVWEVDVAGAESDAMLSPVFASRDGRVIVAGLRGEVDGQEKSWTVFLDGETGRTVATLGLDDGASHYRPEGITPDGRYAVVRRSGAEVEREICIKSSTALMERWWENTKADS